MVQAEKKLKYTFIAVVLVYRNSDDLTECIISMKNKINDIRIIVVNSFYDEETKNAIQQIASEYDCDFINIENRGYSYGNNKGIEFANSHYEYKYIIISNPDITISEFNLKEETKLNVIAPKIIARDGKKQNPMLVIDNRLSKWLIYEGFRKNKRILLYSGIGINKIIRELFAVTHRADKGYYKIYQPHGSFVLLNRDVVSMLHPIFDENMFLFAEENVLAYKLKKHNFRCYYCPEIVIHHKEDGSMKLSGTSVSSELKKSNIYFYENYIKKLSMK